MTSFTPRSIPPFVLAALGVLLHAATMGTGHAGSLADAQARYRQDMAACDRMPASPDSAACRLEARNALAEARRGRLDDDAAAAYRDNALRRCDIHQGEDRLACEARMRGEGRVEGTVEGGGILRELTTVVPGK